MGDKLMSKQHERVKLSLQTTIILILSCLCPVSLGSASGGKTDFLIHETMKWRCIGPFRGGRVTAVAGHKDHLFTFYMGTTGGGIWKTTDCGAHWFNISDGYIKTSSVGAIAIADNNPKIIYAGMGESPVRAVKSTHGNGVYKSPDGGKTWVHLGLQHTYHISKIIVHPTASDTVYVAAQGSSYAATPDRGVYKTTNGGKTWEKILFINPTSGANDICIDPTAPDTLYVTLWDHQRFPWQLRSGGPGSGIYKSIDGGMNWSKLLEGLPEKIGKAGIALSPTSPQRIWAIVEAEAGGLYRSDDSGNTWVLLNTERLLRTRPWYYMHIFADPLNSNTVYILNAPMLKSIDGGKSFSSVRTPHSDNHDLWINPVYPNMMVEGNDGGASVTTNGGESWSTVYNQPTGQFYRVNTDNRYAYRVYGAQQDNTTVAILSRTKQNGIARQDWFECGGAENAFIDFDPAHPERIYATGGRLTEFTVATQNTRNISYYPHFDLASTGNQLQYRYNWNAPFRVSVHNPDHFYHAAQMVFYSQDRGNTWQTISSDLTRNQKEKQGPGCTPFTNEGAGGEMYNTISYLAECPHKKGTIWAGTDDGRIHITTDNGVSWRDISPQLPGEGEVNCIEISPHSPATAYIAVLRYKFNDHSPYIYKTDNRGKSWTQITTGLAEGEYVRVIREDPVRKGLLFIGTFSGVGYSFDGGNSWESFSGNLPVVPVTDLKIQNDDLIAATEGRGFWILDDLTPMRLHKPDEGLRLYKPRDSYIIQRTYISDEFLGDNPVEGALIYYHLPKQPETENPADKITITISADQKIIRTLKPSKKQLKPGLNALIWDLRGENRKEVLGIFFFPGYQGLRVPPGQYTVSLHCNDQILSQTLAVKADPDYRVTTDFWEQYALLEKAFNQLKTLHNDLTMLYSIRNKTQTLHTDAFQSKSSDDIIKKSQAILKQITEWEDQATQPRQTTMQDVINFRSKLDGQYGYLINELEEANMTIVPGAKRRFEDLEREWLQLMDKYSAISNEVKELNILLLKLNWPYVPHSDQAEDINK